LVSLAILARRWGLVIVGALFAIGGLTYGAIPHQVPYQSITKAFIAHYLSGFGTGYMQMVGSSNLYLVHEEDYSPAFSADYLNHGNVLISFLYRVDATTSIDASSDTNVHLVGIAYKVERITLYHQFGQKPQVFSTPEYTRNPNGYNQHSWMAGIALSLLGLILIGLGYLLPVRRDKHKKQSDFSDAPAATLETAGEQPEQANQFQEPGITSDEIEYKEYSAKTAQSPRIPIIE
jgi:hypothetical protein